MMDSILFGIQYAMRHWRIGGFIFIVQLIGAAIVGFLLQMDISIHLGHSLSGDLFADGFNYSVFKDLTRTIPDVFSTVTTGFIFMLLVFFFLSIFLHGGAIKSLVANESKASSVWRYGKTYFFPFLLVAFISLVLLILCTGVLWVPVLINFEPLIEGLESDRLFFYILYGVLVLYLVFASLIVSWSINSRINYAVLNESIWSSMKSGLSWTIKRAFPLSLIFLLVLSIGILLMFLNVKIDKIGSIWIAFFVSLFFLFCRVMTRVGYYSTLANFASAIDDSPS